MALARSARTTGRSTAYPRRPTKTLTTALATALTKTLATALAIALTKTLTTGLAIALTKTQVASSPAGRATIMAAAVVVVEAAGLSGGIAAPHAKAMHTS